MNEYRVYSESKVVQSAIIKAKSIKEAEEIAENNYIDLNWKYVDGTDSSEIIKDVTELIKTNNK